MFYFVTINQNNRITVHNINMKITSGYCYS